MKIAAFLINTGLQPGEIPRAEFMSRFNGLPHCLYKHEGEEAVETAHEFTHLF